MLTRKAKNLIRGIAILTPSAVIAYYLAFLLRFDGEIDNQHWNILLSSLPWVISIKAAAIFHAKLHQEHSHYVTLHDMITITRVVSSCSIGITLLDTMALSQFVIPRSVILLDWGTSIILLVAARTLPRIIKNLQSSRSSKLPGIKALIVGANDAGEALLRTIRQCPDLNYLPIGFIDEQEKVLGKRIAGIPVLGPHAAIPTIAKKHGVEVVLLAAGSISGKEIRKLIDLGNSHDLRIKVLPSYEQLLKDRVDVRPRSVAIADLLRRPSIDLDNDSIKQWINGKTVLVTGSAGSIGSEICRQLLSQSPAKIIVVDRSETGQFFLERDLQRLAHDTEVIVALADLTDRDRLDSLFVQHRPQIVFHAAAYKHVPLMEAHVGEAIKNIVLATKNLVDLAEEYEAEGFVMISTDKAVNPTSVMGSCKRLAEQYVQAKAATSICQLVTVRFGNVLDSAGSVVPIFREQIERGGPVTITHPKMVRYFMLIPEAAQLVIQAGAIGQGGEIFVLDMGKPVRIINLAEDMIRLSGLRVGEDIEIEVTGLRPGEKLYEELYGQQEKHQPTKHSKIMVAASEPQQLLNVIQDISHLEEMVNAPNEEVRAALHGIIPVQRIEKSRQANTAKAA